MSGSSTRYHVTARHGECLVIHPVHSTTSEPFASNSASKMAAPAAHIWGDYPRYPWWYNPSPREIIVGPARAGMIAAARASAQAWT